MSNIEYQHPVIDKYSDILGLLVKERVMAVEYYNGKFLLSEQCDDYFWHELTKNDCLELSNLFRDIAEIIN